MSTPEERTFRVLVVDDEEVVLSFVTDALADENCEVITASNGNDALQIASRQPCDLILSDIRMPGMDGITLVRRVRELQPNISPIFMTGYANLNSAKDAIKEGASDYIMKPFELAEIRQAIRNAIRKIIEAEEQSPDRQLKNLSDLNLMLFTVGDRKSLITSSLKFAIIHQRADHGSVLYRDVENDCFINISIRDETTYEETLASEPLVSCLDNIDIGQILNPVVVTSLEEHPIYKKHPDPQLREYLQPNWMRDDLQMVVVPVARANTFYGMIMLGFGDDTVRLTETTLQFLSITASQLAVNLENLSLLEQTQEAYARLKELQDETIQLEKMATRGAMSAEIGHELNNFLGVIAGNISLLDFHLKKQNYHELGRYVTSVSETLERIRTFTDNLVDLRPISSTKEIIYFDRLIIEVVNYLRPQKRFQNIRIQVDEQPEEIPFEADATQIQQLLYNLFNNAADATEDSNDRVINVSLTLDLEKHSFTLAIQDNGTGFDPELLIKAFHEKFTTKKTGHGFGLVVCKRIIDYYGGELGINSTPGEGTTITITFPTAVQAVQPV